ncbi:fibronectin type III domain-containing protein [Actinophytocola sp. NPDC049390]|uniref:fibronectin type III domain-containing protein n=1 Tax=Actinophytocola sp. NPDC049390 TaxID=3363894 RepID=UPI0037AC97A1
MTSKTAWRTRLPVVAVVVACVTGVVAAVTGAANPVSAVQFLLPGHWVYNSALSSVLHVDGSTGNVDARAGVPGSPGDQVLQGDTSAYVVGSERITEFGKSSLEVEKSSTPASKEKGYGVETAGGPYLVYRQSGKVVRLGDPSVTLELEGRIGTPVATRDGTLWLPRAEAGWLCQLRSGAKAPACQVPLPRGHKGALTVVRDEVVFVDTTSDTLHTVEKDRLGAGRKLGLDASDDAVLADTDVAGRIAILDANRIHLVDTEPTPESGREPVQVDLPDGDYAGPVSTGEVVAVVDRTTDTLITYDSAGEQMQRTELPAERGDPRISRGEDDRLYVDGDEGKHVVVVDRDGELTDVPIEGDSDEQAAPRGGDADSPPVAGPKPERPKPDQPERQQPPATEEPDPRRERQPPPRVPPTQPGAPAGVSATPGNAAATVRWGAAADNRSPITGYRVTWAGGSRTTGPGARSLDIPRLANGTRYVFTVAAVNGVGVGPGSSSNPVTPTAPFRAASAPRNLVATNDFDNQTVTVNWAAPADMGTGRFAHYEVNVGGFRQVTVTGLSATVTGVQVDTAMTVSVRPVTTNPAGAQVAGGTASTRTEGAPPADNPVVTLRQGAATDEYCGGEPGCSWMHVEASGFPPDTMLTFTAHSTQEGYENSHATPTDENGFADIDRFAYAGVGYEVWVTVTTPDGTVYTSNRITWRAG